MITVCPACGKMREIKGEAQAVETYSPGVIDLECDKCKAQRDKPLTPREQARYWMREATYQRGRADARQKQVEKVIELANKYGDHCRRCGFLEYDIPPFLEWVSDSGERAMFLE